MSTEKQVQTMAGDTGRTMTGMILVDSDGDFSIGKAATTPGDQPLRVLGVLAEAYDTTTMPRL